MSRRHLFLAATTVAFVWLLSPTRSADAQKMYKWTDKDGKVHFSNVAPSGEQAEEESGVSGIDASGSSGEAAAPAPAAVEAPNEQPGLPPEKPAAAESSKPSISDEAFSSQATATRLRLRRELAQAKEDAKTAATEFDAARSDRDKAQQPGLEMLQSALDPNHQKSSGDIDEIRRRKEKAEARIVDIRKQYGAMLDEATKRNGGQKPSWWLPIE